MTVTEPYVMPPRDWGDEPAPEVELPIIIVSSRDGAPVPRVPAAIRLEAAAMAAGWTVEQTYALASVPEARYLNGNVRKRAHLLHTVAVRMTRRWSDLMEQKWTDYGFALWHREDDGGWRFSHAFVNGAMVGARSIVEVLK